MRISFQREAFAKAFDACSPICPTKTENPNLLNVKLTASKDGAVLQATDHEVSLTVKTACQADKPGTCLLPAQTVSSILSQCTEDKLVIESSGVGKLRIAGERLDFGMNTENVAEFPVVKGFDAAAGKYSTVSALWLKEAVRRTISCCTEANSNFALGGICIEFTASKKAYLAATDANRCAVMQSEASPTGEHVTPERAVILPQKAARRLMSALDGHEGQIDICCGQTFTAKTGDMEFYAALVSGRFPNWRGLMKSIPEDTTVTIPAGVLASIVRQAMIVTSKETRGLAFEFSASMLVVRSVEAQRGSSSLSCPIVLSGEPVTLELNGRYVLDFAALLKPETPVTISLKDSALPVGFFSEDGFAYAVMPIVHDEEEPEPKAKEVVGAK